VAERAGLAYVNAMTHWRRDPLFGFHDEPVRHVPVDLEGFGGAASSSQRRHEIGVQGLVEPVTGRSRPQDGQQRRALAAHFLGTEPS
jgi:hypothetical protein